MSVGVCPGEVSLGDFEDKRHRGDIADPAALRHALKDVPTGGIGIDSTQDWNGLSP